MHRKTLLALIGGLLLALGAIPPWIMVAPWYDGPVITVYYDGMGSGLETFGVVTLPLGVAAAALGLLTDLEGTYGWAAIAIGVVGFAATLVGTVPYAFPPEPFSPGIGALASWIGALCVVGGGVDALRNPQTGEDTPSRTSA